MTKIYLDANYFLDILEKRQEIELDKLNISDLYISPLTIHVFLYIHKIKIPNGNIVEVISRFKIVPISADITDKSLHGPTSDFEDNIQLHCAISGDCDVFLTRDKKLLALKFYGKLKIAAIL